MTHAVARPRLSLAGLIVLSIAACGLGQEPTGQASGPPATTVSIVAQDLAFAPVAVSIPSGVVFALAFDNQDPGILHNVTIQTAAGQVVFRGETFAGIEQRIYRVVPLDQGEFRVLCDVHPTMVATLKAMP